MKDKLFEQFPPVSTKDWIEKIQSDLKGSDFKKKLIWKTNEGLEVKPFYRQEDIDNLLFTKTLSGEIPFIRHDKPGNNEWLVRQDIEVKDYNTANRKAIGILNRGVNSLGFVISDPGSVNERNFNILLNDIHLKAVEINFLCNGMAKEIFGILKKISSEKGLDPTDISAAIETDPLGRLMVNGILCVSIDEGFDYLASLTNSASSYPKLSTIHINASYFNNAGTDIVQDIAFGISMGNEYMSSLTERNITPDIVASKIRFSFGIGGNYFFEVAKLRAARLLWYLVQKGYIENGDQPLEMKIHCVTSRWNKTIYDPCVNMLRTQTEAMSAIMGGTDSLTVEPFDIVYKTPDEFSERIARNQQLILKEEAHFDKVADPAAGSYYIENLTELLTENAWKLFLEIEDQGGFLSALRSGFIQKKISESAAKKKNEVATRRTILLGTNQYPKQGESAPDSANAGDLFIKRPAREDITVDPVTLFRGSEEYEKIRMATERSGKKPAVFLFPVGDPVMRKARAQFASSFFSCAGYEIIDNNGFRNVEDNINFALQTKPEITVICSSDEEYEQYAPGIFNSLKDKSIIVIAGNPASTENLKSLGMELFIHIRSNLTDTLNYFNKRLGITAS